MIFNLVEIGEVNHQEGVLGNPVALPEIICRRECRCAVGNDTGRNPAFLKELFVVSIAAERDDCVHALSQLRQHTGAPLLASPVTIQRSLLMVG